MDRMALVVVMMLVPGCGKAVDSLSPATQQHPQVQHPERSNSSRTSAIEESDVKPFTGESIRREMLFEGILDGCWLRQQSGETLGDYSKVTINEPLQLVVGNQSLPLLGETEELEHTLLANAGKTVRLEGYLGRVMVEGRGIQSPQSGYYGAIPAHVIQFLMVSGCEVIAPDVK